MMRAVIQSSGPPPLTSAPSHSLFSQVSLMQVLNDLRMTLKWSWMTPTIHVNVETVWYATPYIILINIFRQTEVKSFSQWTWTDVWKHDPYLGQHCEKCVGVSIIYVGDSNYLQEITFSYCKYYYMSAHFYKKGISFATYSRRQIMWR